MTCTDPPLAHCERAKSKLRDVRVCVLSFDFSFQCKYCMIVSKQKLVCVVIVLSTLFVKAGVWGLLVFIACAIYSVYQRPSLFWYNKSILPLYLATCRAGGFSASTCVCPKFVFFSLKWCLLGPAWAIDARQCIIYINDNIYQVYHMNIYHRLSILRSESSIRANSA